MKQRLYNGFLIFCLAFPFQGILAQGATEKQFIVAMRAIGHDILLTAGDSTSRVLPVINQNGSYFISFEDSLEVNPELLVSAIDSVLAKANFENQYVVEVLSQADSQVVYSYVKNGVSGMDLIPCKGRGLPKDLYVVQFTRKEPVLFSPQPVEMNSQNDESLGNNYKWFFATLFLIVLFIYVKIRFFRNKKDTIVMGKFNFDPIQQWLTLEKTKIELSNKETELLKLLYSNLNETVNREEILHVVWGDEGDYIGRTLDVFISKLRKKLVADDTIKILNSRGVGYKLVIGDAN